MSAPDKQPPRYLIRVPGGKDLACPSLGIWSPSTGAFSATTTWSRQERAPCWIRAGDLPALHGARERRREPRRALVLLAIIAVLGLGLILALKAMPR